MKSCVMAGEEPRAKALHGNESAVVGMSPFRCCIPVSLPRHNHTSL